jgi:DNA mismatch endonuclease (patch repair protein)
MPKSRLDFWRPKLEGNRERDKRQRESLEDAGWTVLTVWECQVGDRRRLASLAEDIRAVMPYERNPTVATGTQGNTTEKLHCGRNSGLHSETG